METMRLALKDLSDHELLARTLQLAAEERQVTALLVAHLAEVDARRLHLAEGYPSLFAYCTELLRLSEHAAYHRIEAARAGRRFPMLLEMLAEGSLTLTTAGLLAPHLTAENHQDLLGRVRGKSKRAVEELLAEVAPRPPVPAVIRRLPSRRPSAALTPAYAAPCTAPESSAEVPAATTVGSAVTPPPATMRPHTRSASVAPLAPQRYKIQFTARVETYEKLQRAQDLLRHQIPDGDLDQIVDLALTALLEEIAKKKLAATNRPRGSRPTTPGSRHIPAYVKRAVWLRDGGRCAFVTKSGRRCTAIGFLEFHHVTPCAMGGETTIENIQLRCRAHNVYEAELSFGLSIAREVRETRAGYSVRAEFGFNRPLDAAEGRVGGPTRGGPPRCGPPRVFPSSSRPPAERPAG